ncbi:MAG: tetratricopeptide repeat protein [Anaerolineales bacterium]|nr:tetratricopeptide repeat protein [Chloroflexota bacterium]MBL6982517.1 tetratricopeptide repeat protein [Anaerolineales bacterium]
MAKVPLRTFLREIEDAIEEGQTDEAVQQCRHVLKVFPKHIDTYRLLGKAFLEAQRYGSAADIFQRVLSAIPDDFVSHVGMSIIREDESNLDTSLWHMERAFEIQPYNPAIQGEVRRLYGKRDGMEPSKARLTRGALARTYAKGDHYEQAIAEIRAALTEEPDRSDLQVLLAEMYAKIGENVKAIENCSLVLKNLPFCLPANRLLGNLLQGTDREDESKTYLQRVHALDPYEVHISSHAPSANDVPEQAVTIDRMDWRASTASSEADRQPEWASSLGVDVDEPDSREAGVPDWLASASEDSPVSQESGNLSQTDDDELPEWMQDAGWGPSSGDIEEDPSPLAFDDQPDEEPDSAIEAELPDWVKDMAPAEASMAATQSDDDSADIDTIPNKQEELVGGDTPDWLSSIEDEGSPELTAPGQEQELPDWLDSGSEQTPESAEESSHQNDDALPDWLDAAAEESPPVSSEPKPADEIPDWLKGVDETIQGEESEDAESTGVTDFLTGLGRDSEEEIHQPQADAPAEADAPADAGVDEIPDWLKSDEPDATEETQIDASLSAEPRPEDDTVDDLDWLKDIEDKEADEPSDGIAAEPTDDVVPPADDIPDWLKSVEHEDVEPTDIGTTEPDTVLEELEAAAGKTIPSSIDDDIPDSMKPVESEAVDFAPITDEDTLPTDTIAKAEPADIPDWLKTLDDAEEESIKEAVSPEPVEEPVKDETIDVPDWLDELAEASLADQGEDESQPQATDSPDWLAEISEGEPDTDTDAAEPAPVAEAPSEEPEFKPTPEIMRSAAADALEMEDEEERTLPNFDDPEAAPLPEQDFPEWLSTPDDSVEEADTEPAAVEEPASDDSAFPEWLTTPTEEKSTESESEPATEFEDADAAMAWLEGLAAKQGVSEEELISSPDDRPEKPPDWAQDTTAEEAVDTEVPVTPEPKDDAEPVEAIHEPITGEITPEDIPEWLQDGAFAPATEDVPEKSADQVVPVDQFDDEQESEPDVADESVKWLEGGEKLVEADDSELPGWLADSPPETQPQEPATEMELTGDPDDTPDWLKDALGDAPAVIAAEQEDEAAPAATTEEPAEEDAGLPDWLKAVSPEDEPAEDATWIREFGKEVPSFERAETDEIPADAEAIADAEADTQLETDSKADDFMDAEPVVEIEGDEAVADEEPLPDWLQDFDSEKDQPEPVVVDEQPDEDEYAWRPSELEKPVDAEGDEVVPQEKLDINQASLIELERLPGMGFRRAQTVFSYREEHGAFDKLDDLLLLGIEAENLEGIKDLVEVKLVPKAEGSVASSAPAAEAPIELETKPSIVTITPEAPEDAEDEHHAVQIGAQEKLSKGDISGAMEEYEQLIKKGKRIDAIINDLEASDQAVPDNPEILQALGDAYMRADRLQEALDTYSKVEQLLQ